MTMKKMIFSALIQSRWSIQDCNRATCQKCAIRLVNESHSTRHCDEMFAKEGCLKFRDMHKLACARIAVKYFYDNLPRGNVGCFSERKSAYEIRNSIHGKKLKIPSTLTKQMEQMCCTKIPMIWNKEVPTEMKSLQETAFIHAYKEHFLQKYRSFSCDVPNCRSCKNSRNL